MPIPDRVREAQRAEHQKKAAAAWAKNGFQEDPGAADLIARAKAKRARRAPTPAAPSNSLTIEAASPPSAPTKRSRKP